MPAAVGMVGAIIVTLTAAIETTATPRPSTRFSRSVRFESQPKPPRDGKLDNETIERIGSVPRRQANVQAVSSHEGTPIGP